MCWVVVTPISVPIAKAYHVSDVLVSVIPLSYMVIYAFANFPSNWLIDVKGIRAGILVGAAGTAIGTGLRCLVSIDFMFAIIGQIVCAIVQPVILNAPTTIAIRWFVPESVIMCFIREIGSFGRAVCVQHCRNNFRRAASCCLC
jgi:MFS transporter, FLVCR family, MFS-domain-containing protein 7